MPGDIDAVLILGWELDDSNLRALMALARPDLDPSNQEMYQQWLTDCQCDDMNGWYLAHTCYEGKETYYLSAFTRHSTVCFESIVSEAPQVLASGRLIASNIGISENRPMRLHAELGMYD